MLFLPFRFVAGDYGGVFHFVQQDITAFRFFCHEIQRSGIAGDDDCAVRCGEFIAVAFQCSVADRKSLHRNQVIPVDNAGFNFCSLNAVAGFVCFFETVNSEINVGFIGLLDMIGHVL